MASLRKFLSVGLGVMVLPVPAAASQETAAADVCGAIARIAAAADVRPAFLPIRRALAAGQAIVPGFAAEECRVSRAGIECRGRRYVSVFRHWPDLATCPGVVAFEPPLPFRQPRYPSNRSYRLGRFLIGRGVLCPGCRALGPPFFYMHLDPQDR